MKPLQKTLILICILTFLTLSAQYKNIIKLDRNYFILNSKDVNILEKNDGEQITIPQGIKLLVPLSNGNYFTSSSSKELQEVNRYDDIVLLDKNFKSILLKVI